MSGLRSEHISNRLFFFMLVIILSLLFWYGSAYCQQLSRIFKTKQALVEIKKLKINC